MSRAGFHMVVILCLTLGANLVQAQGVYASVNAGYGLGAGTHYIGVNTTSTGTAASYEGVFGSLGQGYKFGGSAGYMFNQNLGAEVGVSYWLGKSFEFTYQFPTSSSTYKWSGSGFAVVPSIVVSANMKLVNPYARLGLVLASLRAKQETLARPSGPTVESTFEESGGLALGYAGALGIDLRTGGIVDLFAEVALHSVNSSPDQAELTRYVVGGVDQLVAVDHRVTSYKDSFNAGEANTSMGVRRPFSAVGMVIGARIHL